MDLSKVFNIVSGMSSIQRFSMVKLTYPESVLEHTGMVGFMCYLIGNELNYKHKDLYPDEDTPLINMGVLLSRTMVHDIDELITGDIPRPTKYFSDEARKTFETVEKAGIAKLAAELISCEHAQEYLINDHANAKEGPEGTIVAISDMLAVVYKVWEEVLLRSNHTMIRQANQVYEYLQGLYVKINEAFDDPQVRHFLYSIVDNAKYIAKAAADSERNIYGTIRQELSHK